MAQELGFLPAARRPGLSYWFLALGHSPDLRRWQAEKLANGNSLTPCLSCLSNKTTTKKREKLFLFLRKQNYKTRQWILKDPSPRALYRVRGRRKMGKQQDRCLVEFLGTPGGSQAGPPPLLFVQLGLESSTISWAIHLSATQQQHFTIKKRILFKDRSHFADLKSDHTEALSAKMMVFPDILNSTINNSVFHLTFKKSSISKKLTGKSSQFQELANTVSM